MKVPSIFVNANLQGLNKSFEFCLKAFMTFIETLQYTDAATGGVL